MDRSIAVAAAVAVTLVGLAAIGWPRAAETPPVRIVTGGTTRSITVHVSGEVALPGLVTLRADARVADAIAAAGGATHDAELGLLNLAAPAGPGSRIVVPSVAAANLVGVGEGGVRLNTASAADLEGLQGVGPVLAERIVRHRDEFGPFAVVEDLLDVPGIGEAKLAALRPDVIVP